METINSSIKSSYEENEKDDINLEYMKSLFSSIELGKNYLIICIELKKSFKNDDYNFSFSKEYSQCKFTIKIKLRKNSLHNLCDSDIFFNLILDKYFPDKPPIVKCMTNVTYKLFILKFFLYYFNKKLGLKNFYFHK